VSQKQETTFANLVNSKLDPRIYYEKMNNPYRSGIPDFYYEGPSSILWVEYKWIAKPWTEDKTPEEVCDRKEWGHQRRWLERAYNNDVMTTTIVGIGLGRTASGYVLNFPYWFNVELNAQWSTQAIAEIIERWVV